MSYHPLKLWFQLLGQLCRLAKFFSGVYSGSRQCLFLKIYALQVDLVGLFMNG